MFHKYFGDISGVKGLYLALKYEFAGKEIMIYSLQSGRGEAVLNNYRRYPRYSVNARALITRRDESSPEKLTAQINTISRGGIGFYSNIFLEISIPVTVELLIDAGGRIEILEGKIVSICSQENDYFVGISFDTAISEDRFAEILGC